jgi:hypothetical protein
MNSISELDLHEIRGRVLATTSGNIELYSIEAKNHLMRLEGNWPDVDDLANYTFFVNAKNDMINLLWEIEKLKKENSELKVLVGEKYDY